MCIVFLMTQTYHLTLTNIHSILLKHIVDFFMHHAVQVHQLHQSFEHIIVPAMEVLLTAAGKKESIQWVSSTIISQGATLGIEIVPYSFCASDLPTLCENAPYVCRHCLRHCIHHCPSHSHIECLPLPPLPVLPLPRRDVSFKAYLRYAQHRPGGK